VAVKRKPCRQRDSRAKNTTAAKHQSEHSEVNRGDKNNGPCVMNAGVEAVARMGAPILVGSLYCGNAYRPVCRNFCFGADYSTPFCTRGSGGTPAASLLESAGFSYREPPADFTASGRVRDRGSDGGSGLFGWPVHSRAVSFSPAPRSSVSAASRASILIVPVTSSPCLGSTGTSCLGAAV
jgi:hypothetical protein